MPRDFNPNDPNAAIGIVPKHTVTFGDPGENLGGYTPPNVELPDRYDEFYYENEGYKPGGTQVVFEPDLTQGRKQMLYLPQSQEPRVRRGLVRWIGPGVKQYAPGDLIQLARAAGIEIDVGGVKYFSVPEDSILGTVVDLGPGPEHDEYNPMLGQVEGGPDVHPTKREAQ